MPGDFDPADVHAEAAGDGERADTPGAGGAQCIEKAGRVRAGEQRRHPGATVTCNDQLVSEVDKRTGGVGADHVQTTGDEDHRITSESRWDTQPRK
ncbi:MAG TPA: hypothetical protein VIJ18_12805 [Microbacteriaceae bacterium]